MFIIMIVSVSILFYLRTPIKQYQPEHQISEEQDDTPASIPAALRKIWGLTVSYRFLCLIPQVIWAGISIAFYSGLLVEML